MPRIRQWITLSFLAFITACSGGKGMSAEEQAYYQDMNGAVRKVRVIHSYTNSSKYSKPGYNKHLAEITPDVVKVFRKYKGSNFSEKNSYQALVKAMENYGKAKTLWDDSKGLDLVNRRISEGGNSLDKAVMYLDQEQNPEKYKPEPKE